MPLVTIYRFDSPCGKFCYIGQARDMAQGIGKHRADGSIFEHCSACETCQSVQQRDEQSGWTECFRELGSATGKERVDQLESEYLEAACRDYIRDPQDQPFPLNKTAGRGDPDLLQAARNILGERDKYAALQSQRDSINRALDQARQERNSLRQERDDLREQNRAKASGCGQIALMAGYTVLFLVIAGLFILPNL